MISRRVAIVAMINSAFVKDAWRYSGDSEVPIAGAIDNFLSRENGGLRPEPSIGERLLLTDFAASDDLSRDASGTFERALSKLAAAGGGRLSLPPGDLNLTRPLRVRGRRIFFSGAGFSETRLVASFSGSPVIDYTGEGDSTFCDFSTTRRPSRSKAQIASSDVGFQSDPGVGRTTLRLELRRVFCDNHQGDGIRLVNPELAFVDGCGASNNLGNGCSIVGRDVDNISNLVSRSRFRDNGDSGLSVKNISHSGFVFVECLNNRGLYQMDIDGSFNEIIQADLEGFALDPREDLDRWALRLKGAGHLVSHPNIFKTGNGVLFDGATEGKMMFADIKGDAKRMIGIGISIDKNSNNMMVDSPRLSFVRLPARRQ